MLNYAERTLFGTDKTGRKHLNVYVHDFDTDTSSMVESNGYFHNKELDRPMSRFSIAVGSNTFRASRKPHMVYRLAMDRIYQKGSFSMCPLGNLHLA